MQEISACHEPGGDFAYGCHLKVPYSLTFLWTLGTGPRRTTVADLAVTQLPKTILKVNYVETRAKGGKIINLVVTSRLAHRTLDYCQTTKNKAAATADGKTARVLLNSRGRPVTSKSPAFERVADRLGLSATPHMSRYTVATNMKSRLEQMEKQSANINPIKVIQHLLAHSSAEPTELYLASANSIDAGTLRAILETEEALG